MPRMLPIPRGRSGPVLALSLLASLGGCLDDDRCGPDQRRAGVRCVPLLEPDAGAADATTPAPTTDGLPATCALTPTPEQLVGSFAMAGAVQQSTCNAPLPAQGAPTTTEVAFSREGDALAAVFTLLGLSTDGAARVEADGRVVVTAAGNLLGMDFSAEATLCFEALTGGSYEAKISLANASGPLCAFAAAGAFSRK